MEDTRLIIFQFLFFVSVCMLFFLLVFSFFRGLFIISSGDIFRRNLPIQRYLSNGNFHNCLPTE